MLCKNFSIVKDFYGELQTFLLTFLKNKSILDMKMPY